MDIELIKNIVFLSFFSVLTIVLILLCIPKVRQSIIGKKNENNIEMNYSVSIDGVKIINDFNEYINAIVKNYKQNQLINYTLSKKVSNGKINFSRSILNVNSEEIDTMINELTATVIVGMSNDFRAYINNVFDDDFIGRYVLDVVTFEINNNIINFK